MKKFILLVQLPEPVATAIRLTTPPTGCDCRYCKLRAKPDSPVITYAPHLSDSKEIMSAIEQYKEVSNFVAAVNIEDNTCSVYKSVSSLSADTDLMVLAFAAYQCAAHMLLHKRVEKFDFILDVEHRGPLN